MGFDRISELKLQFIKMLSDSGLNSKEISDYLNSQSVRTPANKSYSSKLVWVSLKKYRKMLDRLKSFDVVEVSEKLILQQIKILTKPKS